METLKLRLDDATRALASLEAVLKEPFSVIVRDAAIQRFEYTFEAVWKLAREYLRAREGLVASSPKSVFRELLRAGILNEAQTVDCLEMTDRRNDTSHTYKEKVAQAIFENTGRYASMMRNLLDVIRSRLR